MALPCIREPEQQHATADARHARRARNRDRRAEDDEDPQHHQWRDAAHDRIDHAHLSRAIGRHQREHVDAMHGDRRPDPWPGFGSRRLQPREREPDADRPGERQPGHRHVRIARPPLEERVPGGVRERGREHPCDHVEGHGVPRSHSTLGRAPPRGRVATRRPPPRTEELRGPG